MTRSAHITDLNIAHLIDQYFPNCDFEVRIGLGGMNNTTRFIEVGGDWYVLRVYETHQDEAKVRYEQAVLLALVDFTLNFHTPYPMKTVNGDSIARLSDGKLVSLFRYIDGVNPSDHTLSQFRAFGRAVGELSSALSRVNIDQTPVYRPYYEIENAHPNCSLEVVTRFCIDPPASFQGFAHSLKLVADQLDVFQHKIPELKALPHQLVHGDLNVSNLLVDRNEQITAVLDFEFVTQDLRVMEISVCLSDLIDPNQDETFIWNKIALFLEGCGEEATLFTDEIQVIPLLIKLRRLDVFIHFLGRYWDGIDSIDIVQDQISILVNQMDWLSVHAGRIISLCEQYLIDAESFHTGTNTSISE